VQSWIRAVPLLYEGYHEGLLHKVAALRKTQTIYPEQRDIFRALALTPLPAVRVVILGQDPYHGEGEAHGLAFSVPDGTKTPPSLRNIFKEVASDIYADNPPTFSNDLSCWARQGVLLLNAALTVEAGRAGSHKKLGWHALTGQIVATLSQEYRHLVFLLWGAHAHAKGSFINTQNHLVLKAVHPSPLSAYRGFFGCRHFSQTNTYLEEHGKEPISW
jgi:uracil-DNA glycosylase